MHGIKGWLVAGIGMNGGHHTPFNADGLMQDFGERREAIGGAGGIRHNQMVFGQLVVIDAEHNRQIRAVRRCRHQDALGTCRKMQRGFFFRGENAGAFHGDINAELFMRQLGGIFHSGHFDRAATHIDCIPMHDHIMRETAMHRVIAHQMRIGFHRTQIIDADNLKIRAAGFDDGTQHIAADTAKTIDGNTQGHSGFSS